MIIAELRIAMDDKGTISVSGPVNQTMLCYGLLELAKDSIRRQHDEQKSAIQPAGAGELLAFGAKKQ